MARVSSGILVRRRAARHPRSFYDVTNEGVIFQASVLPFERARFAVSIEAWNAYYCYGVERYRNNSASVHAQAYASEYSRVRYAVAVEP